MNVASVLQEGFRRINEKAGKVCKVRIYTYSVGSVYDDDISMGNNNVQVTGNGLDELGVSPNGIYTLSGATFGGSNIYSSGNKFIWFDGGAGFWAMNEAVGGVTGANSWFYTTLIGSYAPNLEYTGSPIVSNAVSYTESWISGIVLPINSKEGTSDFLAVQQGKLSPEDMKLFVSGNVILGGSDIITKIQLGSPTGGQWSIIPEGVIRKEAGGISIFKKAYIRRLTNGSLIGE